MQERLVPRLFPTTRMTRRRARADNGSRAARRGSSKLPEPTAGQSIVRIVGIPAATCSTSWTQQPQLFVPRAIQFSESDAPGAATIVDMAAGDEDGDAVGKVQASFAHTLPRPDQAPQEWVVACGLDAGEGTNDQQQDGGDGEADGDEYAGDDLLMQRNANRRNST